MNGVPAFGLNYTGTSGRTWGAWIILGPVSCFAGGFIGLGTYTGFTSVTGFAACVGCGGGGGNFWIFSAGTTSHCWLLLPWNLAVQS